MALTSTVHVLDITLSHVDRHVYETLALRVPMHPSESPEYFVARVLAYCAEHAEGIAFSRGISDPDAPTIAVRDLTGAPISTQVTSAPDAARVHKASKAAPRVVIYTHRDPAMVRRQLAGARIHKAEAIDLVAIDRALIAALVERLDRRMAFEVTITEGQVYVAIGGATLHGELVRGPIVE